ncbi:chalcone synthase 8-like [Carex rostrata]
MAQDNKKTVEGKAVVLAIGTAVPPNFIYQSDYPDYYFQLTKSEHLTDLKEKFTRICTLSKIQKRYFCLADEKIKEQSLDRQTALLAPWVTSLGMDAAEKALQEWGQPRSRITHLIFHTATGGLQLPGPDYQLVNLLGLKPTVNRYMLYIHGCYAGGTVFRLAKDLAENNPGARILLICSETNRSFFDLPNASTDTLVVRALFGDGAGAVIVGSNPDMSVECPLYEIHSTGQSIIPGTENAVGGHMTDAGLVMHLSPSVPIHITNNIRKCLSKAFEPLGISDWNSLFWIVHPGGRKILDGIETQLNLEKEKLLPSRHVLAEFGNMESGSVIFVMDEMRTRSRKEGKATTGEGAEFGVLLGFGPGLTIETVVLRALAIPN